MANISQYLDKIRSAVYGKDVRGSIVSAIDAINNQVGADVRVIRDCTMNLEYNNEPIRWWIQDATLSSDYASELYIALGPRSIFINNISSGNAGKGFTAEDRTNPAICPNLSHYSKPNGDLIIPAGYSLVFDHDTTDELKVVSNFTDMSTKSVFISFPGVAMTRFDDTADIGGSFAPILLSQAGNFAYRELDAVAGCQGDSIAWTKTGETLSQDFQGGTYTFRDYIWVSYRGVHYYKNAEDVQNELGASVVTIIDDHYFKVFIRHHYTLVFDPFERKLKFIDRTTFPPRNRHPWEIELLKQSWWDCNGGLLLPNIIAHELEIVKGLDKKITDTAASIRSDYYANDAAITAAAGTASGVISCVTSGSGDDAGSLYTFDDYIWVDYSGSQYYITGQKMLECLGSNIVTIINDHKFSVFIKHSHDLVWIKDPNSAMNICQIIPRVHGTGAEGIHTIPSMVVLIRQGWGENSGGLLMLEIIRGYLNSIVSR